MTVFLHGWLPNKGKASVACILMLSHEDNIPNKFRIWKERHIRMKKPYQLPGRTKHAPYNFTKNTIVSVFFDMKETKHRSFSEL